MIKSVKKLLLIALSAIMVLTLLNFVAITVKADGEPVITNENFFVRGAELKIAGGESVDEKDHNGLRFMAVLEKAVAQTAFAKISDITEMGILVIPNSLLSGELTLTTDKAEKATFTFDELGEVTIGGKDYYQMKAYIWNIPSSFYVKDFTARAYISTAESTVYSGALARSIAFVANAAYNDDEVDGDIKTLAEAYIPTYTVIFDVDGGNAIANASIKYGAEVTAVAEKTGYRFDGWTFNGQGIDTASLTVESDSLEITLKAKYTRMLGQADAENFKSIIESDMAGKYALSEDIDMTGVTFTSIGTYSSVPFTGTFDGEGHAIKNLTVSEDTTESSYGKGSVFAHNKNIIRNVFVEFTAPAISQYVGFIGYNEARVNNVAVVMTATANCSYGNWFNGVVVARNQGDAAVVRNCYGELKGLSGSQWCGTVVGYNYSNNYGLTNLIGIANGTTTPSNAAYGCQGTPLFTCSYNASDNDAFRPDANSQLYLDVESFVNSGFEFKEENDWASYWKIENSKLYFGDNEIKQILPEGTPITTASELKTLLYANPSGKFYLANDLDFSEITDFTTLFPYEASPKVWFSGVLDGNGHKITNLYINSRSGASNYDQGGFIGSIDQGVIKNLYIDFEVDENAVKGIGLLGFIDNGSPNKKGTVSNVFVKITLNRTSFTADNRCGGIVGGIWGDAVIDNCMVEVVYKEGTATISNFGTVAGINYSGSINIRNCIGITNGNTLNYGTDGHDVMCGTSNVNGGSNKTNCANYASVSDLIDSGFTFSSANGWAKFWKIESNKLYFGSTLIGEKAE